MGHLEKSKFLGDASRFRRCFTPESGLWQGGKGLSPPNRGALSEVEFRSLNPSYGRAVVDTAGLRAASPPVCPGRLVDRDWSIVIPLAGTLVECVGLKSFVLRAPRNSSSLQFLVYPGGYTRDP